MPQTVAQFLVDIELTPAAGVAMAARDLLNAIAPDELPAEGTKAYHRLEEALGKASERIKAGEHCPEENPNFMPAIEPVGPLT